MTGLRTFSDEDLAPLVALSGMPKLGPARLQTLLAAYQPAEVWARTGAKFRLAGRNRPRGAGRPRS